MRYCEKHGVRMETPEDVCKFCADDPVEMDELASLRARIAAAVAECERIESDAERRGSYADELDTAVCAATQDVARAVRAKLEGR